MAKNYVKYINGNLRKLANYINHIINLNNKYGKAIKDLCTQYKNCKITKSKELIEYEKDLKQSYDKAMKLYNDLTQIAERYKAGRNIYSDIQCFHSNFNLAGLTIYKKVTLELKTVKQNAKNEVQIIGKTVQNKVIQQGTEFAIGKNYGYISYITAKSKIGPDTAGMLDLAHEKRNDLSYTKDAIKLTNWNDPRVASDKEYLRDKVMQQFSYYDFDEDNIPGYFFKNYSEPSQRIANDKDFLEKIKESKNEILSNKKVSMGFPGYGPNTKSNLYYAFGKIDIRNGYFDKNGNLHVKVYDTYDFNREEKNKPLIMAGKNKMLDGELKPFFTIHDIIILKEKLRELWK